MGVVFLAFESAYNQTKIRINLHLLLGHDSTRSPSTPTWRKHSTADWPCHSYSICHIEPTQAHEIGYVFVGQVGTRDVLVQAACDRRTKRRKPCCGDDLAWSRVERHVGSARLTAHGVVACLSGELVQYARFAAVD